MKQKNVLPFNHPDVLDWEDVRTMGLQPCPADSDLSDIYGYHEVPAEVIPLNSRKRDQ